jgi:DNA polymerase-1
MKRIFIPSSDEKVLLSFELEHLETRLLAHFSEDEKLIQLITENEDPHQAIASLIFDTPMEQVTPQLRNQAKEITLAFIYGLTANALSSKLNISKNDTKEYQERYLELFPGLKNLIEKVSLQGKENGFIQTIFGRKRSVSGIDSENKTMRLNMERIGLEFLIQGSAADIIKKSMLSIFEDILKGHRDIHLLIQTGDELLFETRKRRAEKYSLQIPELIKASGSLKVPLRITAKEGLNWLQMIKKDS